MKVYILEIETEKSLLSNVRITFKQTYHLNIYFDINRMLEELEESFKLKGKLEMLTISLLSRYEGSYQQNEIIQSYRIAERYSPNVYAEIAYYNNLKRCYNFDSPYCTLKSKNEMKVKTFYIVNELLTKYNTLITDDNK